MTPTDDLGVVLNAVHGISMEGTINFPTGVQVSPRPSPGSVKPTVLALLRALRGSSRSEQDLTLLTCPFSFSAPRRWRTSL